MGPESEQDANRRPHATGLGPGRALVCAAILLATALYLLAILLSGLGSTSGVWDWISAFLVPASTYAFPAAGALITLRRPRNLIGWLCLASGLMWGTIIALEAYIQAADPSRVGHSRDSRSHSSWRMSSGSQLSA